jgi:GH25 family lysozyme M1 (1,4-beta-N-acetylmuramidase)
MRLILLLITLSALVAAAIASQLPVAMRLRGPQGIDVSEYQQTINWKKVKSQGVAFAYIKATEGTSTSSWNTTAFSLLLPNGFDPHTHVLDTDIIDSYFSRNYIGATNNGIIRGAYHFAHPNVSSGAAQAAFFLAHGGN